MLIVGVFRYKVLKDMKDEILKRHENFMILASGLVPLLCGFKLVIWCTILQFDSLS